VTGDRLQQLCIAFVLDLIILWCWCCVSWHQFGVY